MYKENLFKLVSITSLINSAQTIISKAERARPAQRLLTKHN